MLAIKENTIEPPTTNWEVVGLLSENVYQPATPGTASPYIHLLPTGPINLDFTFLANPSSTWHKDILWASTPPSESPRIIFTESTGSSFGMTIPLDRIFAVGLGTVVTPPSVLRERLDHFRELKPGWDSYGAQPIAPEAIDKAEALLRLVYAASDAGIEPPLIAPCADGGVQFEWQSPSGKELTLGIPPAGTPIDFLLEDPHAEGIESTTEGVVGHQSELLELLDNFIGETDKS